MCRSGSLTVWIEAALERAGLFKPRIVSDGCWGMASFCWPFCFLSGIQYKAMQNKRECYTEACASGCRVSRGKPPFVFVESSERLAQRVLFCGGTFV
jgi:hypothetical protein